MTWQEIKDAVEQAGVEADDEILVIDCMLHDGNKTIQKVHQGHFIRLIEQTDAATLKAETRGCCC